jgi:hypothetical protein
MRIIPVLLALLVGLQSAPARSFGEAELIDGFMRTVFGSEYTSWGWQAAMVKKFDEPVRVYVEDRSRARRGPAVLGFVRSLPGLIEGLEIEEVADPGDASFRIFVIDRADYRSVVAGEIYDKPSSGFAPGKCLVRVVSTRNGISRSDAVIVADEGDFLFQRCMTEEILQGLGPVNDDPTLSESVFNDTSFQSSFTDFDRGILNMLYHPLIRPGMTKAEVRRLLPQVAADIRARLG